MNGSVAGNGVKELAKSKYHPFWKLSSQISFGVHLLAKRLAKSDAEVLKILQAHVDEMDGFLGRTVEDFLIIQLDVRTRVQYLSLPLANLNVLDEMLDDRQFRLAMMNYNEKIEHAINRYTTTVSDTLKDIQKGKEAIGALWQFLGQLAKNNAPLSSKLVAVYNAMLANTEGWNIAFSKLHRKGVALESALSQLGLTITEMQRRVGVASRKEVISLMHSSDDSFAGKHLLRGFVSEKRRVFGSFSIPDKPLPCAPGLIATTDTSSLSKQGRSRMIVQKSPPNLLGAKGTSANHNRNVKSPGQARPANVVVEDAKPITLIHIQGNPKRRCSKAKLMREAGVSESVGASAPRRPAAAPSKPLRSRSTSLEQLKALCMCRKEQQQSMEKLPALPYPERSFTDQKTARQDTMKEQLLQYFKADRKKGHLWSKFRAKPSNTPVPFKELQMKLFEDDLGQEVAWLQEETKALKIYCLPRRNVAPRIHALSVHINLVQELEDGNATSDEYGTECLVGDGRSSLTALPPVPPPLASKRSPA
ncbi:uncharacterized protein ATNIH1004_002689 [Aspergillus tanneri]|uniref:Uncharacterized protein n=1 Tax=Aspergillus tanneri TaxID=1220188 RepID=A0A5M9MZB7_9EURO|nr:uncharacterized protein ATNIH1004_002689 [Aspergillus tanneri]KAA8650009.1 hypothetical protein ATNIH1004_002689 [Aspergillus tanneri]